MPPETLSPSQSAGWAGSAFSSDDDDDNDVDYGTQTLSEDSEDSEDDIPLAQRIPGALMAQKSIRVKEKIKKEYKKKDAQRLEPAGPSIEVEDLNKKLLQLQSPRSSPIVPPVPVSTNPPVRRRAYSTAHRESHPSPAQSTGKADERDQRVVSKNDGLTPRRSTTSIRPKKTNSASRPPSPSRSTDQPLVNSLSPHLRHSKHPSHHSSPGRFSEDNQRESSSTDHPFTTKSGGASSSYVQQESDTPMRTRKASLLRREPSKSHRYIPAELSPPVPPLPQEIKSSDSIQQRVFIGNMQRFNVVDIGPRMSAQDIIKLIDARGELRDTSANEAGTTWMLWELVNEFGMERPIRNYELPAEVYASWNSNTRMNAFIIKKTPLAPLLAQKAIPSSSPTFSGYVRWESKRGKWTKRWMELKEHSIWLSKRDTGKDSTFLCSLSSFDCYFVSSLHKAPKSFVFAIKSTDNLTLFENPADYLHVFSCDSVDGRRWVECILLARSYVLYKERTILFNNTQMPSVNSGPSVTSGKKIQGSTSPFIPLKTGSSNTAKNPFQSGSLLAKTTH